MQNTESEVLTGWFLRARLKLKKENGEHILLKFVGMSLGGKTGGIKRELRAE